MLSHQLVRTNSEDELTNSEVLLIDAGLGPCLSSAGVRRFDLTVLAAVRIFGGAL